VARGLAAEQSATVLPACRGNASDHGLDHRGLEPAKREMFGTDRLKELVKRFDNQLSLRDCAELVQNTLYQFTKAKELQDDLTLLLLRRSPG
jgi:serine phosphatase RsbU (regulator of sigma subunit)